MTYEIRRGDCTGALLTRVRATTYTEAAGRAARKLHGRRAWANRRTGVPSMSGVFVAYLPCGDSFTSTGEPFHVREKR